MKKRMLAAVLCLCMALTLLPVTAAGTDYTGETAVQSATAALSNGGDKRAISLGNDYLVGTKGSLVYFGSYPQTDPTGAKKEPVLWWVLKNDGEKALLLSAYNLDAQQYSKKGEDVTWEKSDLRKWMNTTFLQKAFTTSEQNAIATTHVVTPNSYNGRPGGGDTDDKVFALSVQEAVSGGFFYEGGKYFNNADVDLKSCNTEYACAQSDGWLAYPPSADNWWLRTPGYMEKRRAYVLGWSRYKDLYVDLDGTTGDNRMVAARPALNLDLDKVLFISAAEQALPKGGTKNVAGIGNVMTMGEVSADYGGNSWQVTLRNGSSPNIKKVYGGEKMKEGYTDWRFTFSWSSVSGGKSVHALLVNEDNEVLYYRNIGPVQRLSTVTSSLLIPEGLKEGKYTLKLYRGTTNTGTGVNYASDFLDIPIEVEDGVAPEVTNAVLWRHKNEDNNLRLKFACNEDGRLYYTVQNSEKPKPVFDVNSIDETVWRWEYSYDSPFNEKKIEGIPKSNRDKYVYFVAVDKANNESKMQCLTWDAEDNTGGTVTEETTHISAPGNPRWDDTVVGKALWKPVKYTVGLSTKERDPIGYAVQLYKNSTAVGKQVIVPGTEYTFDDVKETGAAYTFTVEAVAEGKNIDVETARSDTLTLCQVTFVKGEGDTTTQLAPIGGKVAEPTAPSKEKYDFAGWYMDEACTGEPYNFGSPVIGGITLYAKWTEKVTETHVHSYGNSKEYSAWSKSADLHWRQCTAGDECPDIQGSIKDTAPHDFSKEDGLMCSVCGYEREIDEDPDKEPERDPEPEPEPVPKHEHSYDGWSMNEGYHWKDCSDPDCTNRIDGRLPAEEHEYVTVEGSTEPPKCSVCGHEAQPTTDEPGEHECSYGTWSTDSVYHWKECTGVYCPNVNAVAEHETHDYGAWRVTVAATVEATGVETRACMDCGYEQTREIPQREPERYYYNSGSGTDTGGGKTDAPEKVSAPKTADAGALAYLALALSAYTGTAFAVRRGKERG